MDLIPIPVLRERAITVAATSPQCFDIWELKKDIVLDDGLVHWSSAGSHRTSRCHDVPWDMRS